MKKDTIIFVHGAWHGKWCWDKFFKPKFEDNEYDVVTFNLPGHDKPGLIKGINSYSIKDYVNALKEEVSKLVNPPILIGHSMGGLIIQKYLESNTCKKVVLLAPAPPYGVINATLRFSKKWNFYPSLIKMNLYNLVNSEKKSKQAFFSENLPNEELTEYTDQLCSESFLAFLNMMMPRVKIRNQIKIPMLVMGAKNDKIFSEREIRYTANKYNAELMMFEEMAHDMQLDVNHNKVSDAIIQWLKLESQ